MSPTPPDQVMVEVRLRYRPVGDILTCVVTGSDPSRRFTTEPAPGVLVEWTSTSDEQVRLSAVQMIDASRPHTEDNDPFGFLPPDLRDACHDLIAPGRRHSSHPSTHRVLPPTGAVELVREVQLMGPDLRPFGPLEAAIGSTHGGTD